MTEKRTLFSRRRVLFAGAGAVSALAVARLVGRSWRSERIAAPSPPAASLPVALVGCESYQSPELGAAVERGFQLAPPPDVHGKRIVLKPNFVEYSPDRPVTTHVELIRQTVRAFRDLGASEVTIAEGPGHNPDTDEVWGRSGLSRAAADEGARLVDLNTDDLVYTRMRTFEPSPSFPGRALEHLYLPRTVVDADLLVSMPKLKTHHWAGITLGMKNLFGVVPSVKYGWPKNILHTNNIIRSIVELAASIPVAYTIVDGVEGMEGDGPIMGTAVRSRCLLFGRSVYAVEWVGARVMGLLPEKVEAIRLAAAAGQAALTEPPMLGESLTSLERKFLIPDRFDFLRT